MHITHCLKSAGECFPLVALCVSDAVSGVPTDTDTCQQKTGSKSSHFHNVIFFYISLLQINSTLES